MLGVKEVSAPITSLPAIHFKIELPLWEDYTHTSQDLPWSHMIQHYLKYYELNMYALLNT